MPTTCARPATALKVGGHQTSCASASTLMTALYFDVLGPADRVAVKPHAAPVFHAIQYLLGNQDLANLKNFRGLGGAQSYPSRTKDADDVDFSTGSVGLGVATTLFASLVQDYVHLHGLAPEEAAMGRMVAVMGDAELDEGNVFEALLEGWKHDVRNLWWVIDYNRQSLDGVVNDYLFKKINDFFRTVDWNVVVLKYGKASPGGLRGSGRRRPQAVDRRLPEPALLGPRLQGRRRLAPAPEEGTEGDARPQATPGRPRRRLPARTDDQPRWSRHGSRRRDLRRGRRRPPALLCRLHGEGLRPAPGRP